MTATAAVTITPMIGFSQIKRTAATSSGSHAHQRSAAAAAGGHRFRATKTTRSRIRYAIGNAMRTNKSTAARCTPEAYVRVSDRRERGVIGSAISSEDTTSQHYLGNLSALIPQSDDGADPEQNKRSNYEAPEPWHEGVDPGGTGASCLVVVAGCESALRVVAVPRHQPQQRPCARRDQAEDPAAPDRCGDGGPP